MEEIGAINQLDNNLNLIIIDLNNNINTNNGQNALILQNIEIRQEYQTRRSTHLHILFSKTLDINIIH